MSMRLEAKPRVAKELLLLMWLFDMPAIHLTHTRSLIDMHFIRIVQTGCVLVASHAYTHRRSACCAHIYIGIHTLTRT